jgi:hypothetical protein
VVFVDQVADPLVVGVITELAGCAVDPELTVVTVQQVVCELFEFYKLFIAVKTT